MTTPFDDELQNGGSKIEKAKRDLEETLIVRKKAEEQARLAAFEILQLVGYSALKNWPQASTEEEIYLVKAFAHNLRRNFPKIISFVEEIKFETADKFNSSQSEYETLEYGAYLNTEFKIEALANIPQFSPINICWEGRYVRSSQKYGYATLGVELKFMYRQYRIEGYLGRVVESWVGEKDWEVLLVKAKTEYENSKRLPLQKNFSLSQKKS